MTGNAHSAQYSAAVICLLVVAAVMLLPARASASGKNRHYRTPDGYCWYDIWWREQRSDAKTALMLHFGMPREHPWTRPGNTRLAPEDDDDSDELGDDLAELEGDDGGGGVIDDLRSKIQKQEEQDFEQRRGRHRDQKAPAGKIFDYSPNRNVLDIPDGVRKVDNGRFGDGIKFTGKNGLIVRPGEKGKRRTFDGWYKPTALPEESAWLVGSPSGAQLHLLSDGRLRLSWPQQKASDKRRHITSKRAVKPNEWHHISCLTWASNSRFIKTEMQIRVDARVVARYKNRKSRSDLPPLMDATARFCIGAGPDGETAYTGLMDDIRVTTRRRYNRREQWPEFDPEKHPRPVPFGPPLFSEDTRVFHAGFESRSLRIHPNNHPELTWDLGEHAEFADYQINSPFGKSLLVDPAMGFPRIPIQGMSPHKGTLELWFQPMNWDNNTMIGENMPPSHSLIRFCGRDKRSGKIVTFMEFRLPRVSMFGGKGWCQPGTWTHFVWSWSRDDVVETENNWGDTKKGDPTATFRGIRFGKKIWRAMLRRNTDVLDHVEPLYAEIGFDEDVTVYHGQRPGIIVDEFIYHAEPVDREQLKKTTAAWAKKYHPRRQ